MTDVSLTEKQVDEYLSRLTQEEVLSFLESHDFKKVRKSALQEVKNKLIDLIIDCDVFSVKPPGESFVLENKDSSCFYLEVLQIFEKGRGKELVKLLANFIQNSINSDEYKRLVGLLSSQAKGNDNVTYERYHLAPGIGIQLRKPSTELLFLGYSSEDEPQFSRDGKINHPDRIVLIDEMMTTGTTIERALNYLKKANEQIDIPEVFLLLSRASNENSAKIKQDLEDKFQVNLRWILSIEELLDSLHQRNAIATDDFERINEEIRRPVHR